MIKMGSFLNLDADSVGNAFAALGVVFQMQTKLENVSSQTTKTDDNGKFVFDAVAPGKYTLFALFKTSSLGTCFNAESKLLEVKAGQQLTHDLKLRPLKDFVQYAGQFNMSEDALIMCQAS
jgi:hypothetical protein